MSETDLAEVWARSLDELAGMQIEPAHRAWLQLTRPLGLVENTALIATPNEFVKEQLETRLRALITNTLSRELGRSIQLAVTVDPTVAAPGEDHSPSGLPNLAGAPAEPADDPADDAAITTGPMPRIASDRTPLPGEFGPGPREFGAGPASSADPRTWAATGWGARAEGPAAWASGPARHPARLARPRRG